ncbi:hypothetical protein NDU88_001693 [Pleurodeles waltl]|nr:hypothetical protein NDU88_001688 [Pleurodeles waltl]KAJ1081507.1 hypothetical protein NDU88_001689 [Pleurodeles waltl]KAJ1081508.1 hypothetical protein NDU88_001690 [Pleurodeles waltl]KAJ1081509.1 hypothetical protein NDU88_001691 [Pleurodeles waltl]KAJ1081510.1 hypothetical protein NDU88_001692 [Pleurodeles waltl]
MYLRTPAGSEAHSQAKKVNTFKIHLEQVYSRDGGRDQAGATKYLKALTLLRINALEAQELNVTITLEELRMALGTLSGGKRREVMATRLSSFRST